MPSDELPLTDAQIREILASIEKELFHQSLELQMFRNLLVGKGLVTDDDIREALRITRIQAEQGLADSAVPTLEDPASGVQ